MAARGKGKRTITIANLSRQALEKSLRGTTLTPLDFLLGVMRDNKRDIALRFEAARAAAPYVHAKIAQKIEVEDLTPEANKPINLLDLARTVAFLLAKARADQDDADEKRITLEAAE